MVERFEVVTCESKDCKHHGVNFYGGCEFRYIIELIPQSENGMWKCPNYIIKD